MTEGVWGLLVAVPLFIVGLVGTVVPALPGAPLIWLGMLLYGFITGFDRLSVGFYLGQAALAALTFGVDTVATAWGVRRSGGSRAAAWGAVLGSLLILVIGPIGLLVGPLAGAVLAELLAGREIRRAWQAGLGSFMGFVLGTIAKLVIAGAMIAWFSWQVLPAFSPRLGETDRVHRSDVFHQPVFQAGLGR